MLTHGGLPAAWMALAAGWSGGSINAARIRLLCPRAEHQHYRPRGPRRNLDVIAMTQMLSHQVAVLKPCVDPGITNSPCAMVPDVR